MKHILAATAMAVMSMTFANGATIVAIGELTTADGLRGTGNWTEGVSLQYEVTQISPHAYRYDYKLEVQAGAVSHTITQLCEGWRVEALGAETGYYSGENISNPNMPFEIYGIKIEATGTLFEWYLTSTEAPMNGQLYAKGGISVSDPDGSGIFNSVWTEGLDSRSSYLPVPGCVNTVPEPSSLLLISLAGGLTFLRRRT